MAETIEGRVRDLLEAPNFSMTATIRKDGTPHVVPTWVDVDDDHVVLNTAEGRAWPTNLRRDNRITITVPDKDNPYEYVEIRGHVAGESTDNEYEHADKLAKKYLGEDTYPFKQPGEQRVMFRIEPEWVKHYGG
jgi:PPOX class probable F420-dependent enzyme